jgi:hypothetical protein
VALAPGARGAAPIGVPEPPAVRTKRVAALHAHNDPLPGDRALLFPGDDLFVLPEPELGYSIVSFYRDSWAGRPTGTGAADHADLHAGRAALRRRSAALAAVAVTGRAYFDAYAADRLPRAHRPQPGLVYAGAGSGSGVRLAPGIAHDVLSELADVRRAEPTAKA